MSIRPPWLLCLSVLSCPTYAVESGIAPLGFSGALSTPTAATLATGQAAAAFTPYLDGQGIEVEGYNYLLGAGLLPGVEVFGRLATNTVSENCYTQRCGLRDLSASIKAQVPDLSRWIMPVRPAWMPDLALGATDLGGAATNFRSYYGVATWDDASWAASVGFAHALKDRQQQARLDGVFGSLVAQPLPWLQGLVEYDGQAAQAGIRLLTLPSMLPAGIQAQAELRSGANQQSQQSSDRDLWWGVSAKLPLDFSQPKARSNSAESIAAEPVPLTAGQRQRITPKTEVGTVAEATTQDSFLAASAQVSARAEQSSALTRLEMAGDLANQLQAKGFQNIRVGYDQNRWIVSVENQAYQWNSLDALGVALGVWSDWAGQSDAGLVLMLEQQEQTVLSVQTDQACLSAWLQSGATCAQDVLRPVTDLAVLQGWQQTQPWTTDHRPWLVRNQAPLRYRPQLGLAPALNYALGTEFGSLDYSFGLVSTLTIPVVWSGLMAEVRHITVLDESKDYQDGGVFQASALQQGVDRAMLHQYIQGKNGISAHAAVGQMYRDYRGAFVEGQWQSASGAHQLSVLGGAFDHKADQGSGRPMVAGYRYQLPRQDIQLGVKAGEFFDADVGYLIDSRFAFGDTFLSVFFQSTKHPSESSAKSYAGIQVSLPIGWQQSLPMRYGQLRGTAEYSQSIQSEVNNRTNSAVGGPRARLATAPQSIDLKLHNRDRLSIHYVNQHLDRVRHAHVRYNTL